MNPKKIKINAKCTSEMIDDLKNHHGFKNKTNIDMLHYEYTANDKREIELIKELTEIDYEYGNHIIYSITKKQLRKFKLGSIDGIREYVRMKKIIFNSKIVQNVQRILELKLSKEISESITNSVLENKEILKDIIHLEDKSNLKSWKSK